MSERLLDSTVISCIVPTRGRPEWLQRLWDGINATVERLDVLEMVVVADEDDDATLALLPTLDPKPIVVVGPDRLPIPKWVDGEAESLGGIVMLASDDIVPVTPGWDDRVREAFQKWPDRIGMVYTDDGLRHDLMGPHPFVSREWLDAVGYYLPDGFMHQCIDTWIREVATRIGRVQYLGDVLLQHLHHVNRKAPKEAYARTDQYVHIDRAHYAATQDERDGVVERLLAAIEEKERQCLA